MITKERLMAAAFTCAVSTVAYGADITGDDGNPATDLEIDAPQTTIKGETLINDTLTVQPEMTTVVGAPDVTPGGGTPTDLTGTIAGTGGPVKIIQTIIDTTKVSQTTQTGGGFVAETNGDATLKATSSEKTTVDYGRTVTQEVAQAGNANPVGVAIGGTEKYYLTRTDGTIIGGVGPFATEAALDAYLAGETPETLLALDANLGMTEQLDGTGGNLQVGGDANVDGTTTLNGLTNTGDISTTGNVGSATSSTTGDASVGGVLKVDTIQDSSGGGLIRRNGDGSISIGDGSFSVDTTSANHTLTTNSGTKIILGGDNPLTAANEDKNIEVDNNLTVLGTSTTNGITNTGKLTNNGEVEVNGLLDVNGNATVSGSLDVDGFTTTDGLQNDGKLTNNGEVEVNGLLDVNGNATVSGSLDVDGFTTTDGLQNDGTFTNNGAANINGFTTTDGLRNDGTLTNNGFVDINGSADISGVLSLQNTGNGAVADVAAAINNNAGNIESNKQDIQTNTRGIAMVAAMTNTTVLPGNTQAIDFNLSHFEGETGFGFGYARAVNPNLQLKIAVASTTDFDESVVRAGVSYQW